MRPNWPTKSDCCRSGLREVQDRREPAERLDGRPSRSESLKRESLEQDGIDKRKHRGIRADPERQSDNGDRRYWLSKTPAERFEALELLRQIAYGYDPATERLQRVLEVVELERR